MRAFDPQAVFIFNTTLRCNIIINEGEHAFFASFDTTGDDDYDKPIFLIVNNVLLKKYGPANLPIFKLEVYRPYPFLLFPKPFPFLPLPFIINPPPPSSLSPLPKYTISPPPTLNPHPSSRACKRGAFTIQQLCGICICLRRMMKLLFQ